MEIGRVAFLALMALVAASQAGLAASPSALVQFRHSGVSQINGDLVGRCDAGALVPGRTEGRTFEVTANDYSVTRFSTRWNQTQIGLPGYPEEKLADKPEQSWAPVDGLNGNVSFHGLQESRFRVFPPGWPGGTGRPVGRMEATFDAEAAFVSKPGKGLYRGPHWTKASPEAPVALYMGGVEGNARLVRAVGGVVTVEAPFTLFVQGGVLSSADGRSETFQSVYRNETTGSRTVGGRVVAIEVIHVLVDVRKGTVAMPVDGLEIHCRETEWRIKGLWTASTGAFVSEPDELRKEGTGAWSLGGVFSLREKIYDDAAKTRGAYVAATAEGRIDQVAKDFAPVPFQFTMPVTVGIGIGLALVLLAIKILAAGWWPAFSRIEGPALLNHPTRRSLVELITQEGPRTEAQCVAVLGESRGTVRKHLAKLEAARIVVRAGRRKTVLYCLADRPRAGALTAHERAVAAALERVTEAPVRLADAVRMVMATTGYTRTGAWKALRRFLTSNEFRINQNGKEVWLERATG